MTAGPPDTVLVTGASGFVGRVVSQRLMAGGYRVRAASRTPENLPAAVSERVRMPAPDAGPQEWDAFVSGVDHVVHCAAIAEAASGIPASAYRIANVELTEKLAHSARRRCSGRFVFLSSVRAVSGPLSATVVSEDTPPKPEDEYGRSKLAGEDRAKEAFSAENDASRAVILRPVLVYGGEAKGHLATLFRLASLPLPLPLGGLDAPRSLLDIQGLAAAAVHAIEAPSTGGGTFTVCDREPLSVAGILASMRHGLGRPPGLFVTSDKLLSAPLILAGRRALWQRLSGSMQASSASLEATGWQPPKDTFERLAAYAATWK